MKKKILAACIAGLIGAVHAAEVKVVTTEPPMSECRQLDACSNKLKLTVAVDADAKVSAFVTDSSGSASLDRRVEALVADSIDGEKALKKAGGKPAHFVNVPVAVEYANGCLMVGNNLERKLYDSRVLCVPGSVRFSRVATGGSDE